MTMTEAVTYPSSDLTSMLDSALGANSVKVIEVVRAGEGWGTVDPEATLRNRNRRQALEWSGEAREQGERAVDGDHRGVVEPAEGRAQLVTSQCHSLIDHYLGALPQTVLR